LAVSTNDKIRWRNSCPGCDPTPWLPWRHSHLNHVGALGRGGPKQSMLGDEVAHLWHVKHWMRSISFVINQHPATTTGTIGAG